MPSLYRCQKVVVLKSEDELVHTPTEYFVETGFDLDWVTEVSETIGEDGTTFEDRCAVDFKARENITALEPFEKVFAAWEEACNASVLLRRFG